MESSSSETELVEVGGRHRTVLRNSDIESSDSSTHPKVTTAQISAKLRINRRKELEARISTKQQMLNSREVVSSSSSSTMVDNIADQDEFIDRKGKGRESDQETEEIIIKRSRDSSQLNSYISSKISIHETPKPSQSAPKTFRNSYRTPQAPLTTYQPPIRPNNTLLHPSAVLQLPKPELPILSTHSQRVHEVFNRLITGPTGVLSQVNARSQRVVAGLAPPTPAGNYVLPISTGRKITETVKRDRDSLRKRWEELAKREENSREDTFNQGNGRQEGNSAFDDGTPVGRTERRRSETVELSSAEATEEELEEESSQNQSRNHSVPLQSPPYSTLHRNLQRSNSADVPALSHSLDSSSSTIQNSRRRFELEAINLEQQRLQMEAEIQEAEEMRLAEESEEEYQREQEQIHQLELEEQEAIALEREQQEEDRIKLQRSLALLRESPSPPRSIAPPLSSTPRSMAPSPFNSGSKLGNSTRDHNYLSVSTSRLLDTTAPSGLEDDTEDEEEEERSIRYESEVDGLELIEEVTEEGTKEYHGDDSSSSISDEEIDGGQIQPPHQSISQNFKDSPRSQSQLHNRSENSQLVLPTSRNNSTSSPRSNSFNNNFSTSPSPSQPVSPVFNGPTSPSLSSGHQSTTLLREFLPSPPPKLSYSTKSSPRSTSSHPTPPPVANATPSRESPGIEPFSLLANRRRNVNLDYIGERSGVRFAMVDSPATVSTVPSPIRVGLARIVEPIFSPFQSSKPEISYIKGPPKTSTPIISIPASPVPSTPKKLPKRSPVLEQVSTPGEESDQYSLPSLPPTPILSVSPSPSPLRNRSVRIASVSSPSIQFEASQIFESAEELVHITPDATQPLGVVEIELKKEVNQSIQNVISPVVTELVDATSSQVDSVSRGLVEDSRIVELEKRFSDILMRLSIPSSVKSQNFVSAQIGWFLIIQIILLCLAIRLSGSSSPMTRHIYATASDWQMDDRTIKMFAVESEGIWNWILTKFGNELISL